MVDLACLSARRAYWTATQSAGWIFGPREAEPTLRK